MELVDGPEPTPWRCGCCAWYVEGGHVEGIGRCRCPKATSAYGTHPTVRAQMDARGCPDFAARGHRDKEEDRPGLQDGEGVARGRAARRPLGAAISRGKRAMGSMSKLGDALFAELDRLGSVDLSDADAVELELRRAKSVVSVAGAITANHTVAISTARMMAELGMAEGKAQVAGLLGDGDA